MTDSRASRAFIGALIGVGVVVLVHELGGWSLLAIAAGVVGWIIGWICR
ncbi:MAG: hypothetical protein PVH68_17670 [Armatimonadota bacterium]|jgi:glucokinase